MGASSARWPSGLWSPGLPALRASHCLGHYRTSSIGYEKRTAIWAPLPRGVFGITSGFSAHHAAPLQPNPRIDRQHSRVRRAPGCGTAVGRNIQQPPAFPRGQQGGWSGGWGVMCTRGGDGARAQRTLAHCADPPQPEAIAGAAFCQPCRHPAKLLAGLAWDGPGRGAAGHLPCRTATRGLRFAAAYCDSSDGTRNQLPAH